MQPPLIQGIEQVIAERATRKMIEDARDYGSSPRAHHSLSETESDSSGSCGIMVALGPFTQAIHRALILALRLQADNNNSPAAEHRDSQQAGPPWHFFSTDRRWGALQDELLTVAHTAPPASGVCSWRSP